jgi:hypothetical protein
MRSRFNKLLFFPIGQCPGREIVRFEHFAVNYVIQPVHYGRDLDK